MYEALGFHADGQMAEYRNAAGEYVEHGTTECHEDGGLPRITLAV